MTAEAREAAADVGRDRRRVARRHMIGGTREWRRAAGAALVDHDDVAPAPNLGEELVHLDRRPRGGAAGASFEVEERAGRGTNRRRQHRNVERDLPGVRMERVLGDGDRPAPTGHVSAIGAGHE